MHEFPEVTDALRITVTEVLPHTDGAAGRALPPLASGSGCSRNAPSRLGNAPPREGAPGAASATLARGRAGGRVGRRAASPRRPGPPRGAGAAPRTSFQAPFAFLHFPRCDALSGLQRPAYFLSSTTMGADSSIFTHCPHARSGCRTNVQNRTKTF